MATRPRPQGRDRSLPEERLIADGKIADAAEAAAHLGLSRARVTQIVNLTLLSPEIQEQILSGEIDVAERVIRSACSEARWDRHQKQVNCPTAAAEPGEDDP